MDTDYFIALSGPYKSNFGNTLFMRCHLLTLVNVLTNMNKQWLMHLLHYLLMLVNENTVVHCLFMLVHGALTNVNKHNLLF